MDLTKYERKTIILFNETEDTAEVSTYNRRLQRRLDHLAKERPDKRPDKSIENFGITSRY